MHPTPPGGDQGRPASWWPVACALAQAVDTRDPCKRNHSHNVAELCEALAAQLRLAPERVDRIRLAGLLHDVGKIGVPAGILNKPGPLTAVERERMQLHPVLGQRIVGGDLPDLALWIRHHHEHFDGGGYPDRLAGEDIPFESRIIHVADAFEAMTSDRAYRVAPGRTFAITELLRHAGRQFDPVIVHALCRALDDSSLMAA